MNRPLPRERDDLATWITAAMDDDHPRTIGRGWRHKVLDGATVHRLMSTVPRSVTYHFKVSDAEGMIISRVLARTGMKRNVLMRRALAHWLVTREGVDPADIPKMIEGGV